MNRLSLCSLSAITLLGLSLLPDAALSQGMSLKERLVGTWVYVSSTAKLPDGSQLWGSNPKGLFILTDNGHFSWQVFRSDRPKFANRLDATADEYKATMQGSLAYFGTYSVNEAEETVVFYIEGSTFPHSEGEQLKRIITKLTTDELIYSNPATTTGGRVEAVWNRLK
jgi:hypothetical protein